MSNNITVNQKEKDQILILNVEDKEVNLARVDENGVEKEGYLIKKKEKKTMKPSYIKMAALSLVAVVIVSTLVHLLTLPPWEERIYNRYYERLDDASTISLLDNSDFSQAKKWYRQGKSEEAWRLLKNLKDEYSIKTELGLYSALSLMDNGSYKEAIAHFGELLEMPDNNVFVASTRLYRGLCYLKTDNISNAKKDFEDIEKENIEEYKKAQKVLKKIKRHYRKK